MRRIVFGLLLIWLSSTVAGAETISFLAGYEDKEQPPYYMGMGQDVLAINPGVSVEIVKLLEQHIPGLKVAFVRMPWKRCLSELQTGSTDGAFNASFKPERLEMGVYPMKNGEVDTSRRLTTISYSLYKMKNAALSWDGLKFINLTGMLGAPLGYSIVDDLRKLGAQVDEASGTRQNFEKLLKGRVQGVAAQDVTGDALLAQNPAFKDIVKVEVPIVTKPYYLMISKQFVAKNPRLAETIWDTIGMLREKELNNIAAKYAD